MSTLTRQPFDSLFFTQNNINFFLIDSQAGKRRQRGRCARLSQQKRAALQHRSVPSITSSCNRDATWIILTICASGACVGSGAALWSTTPSGPRRRGSGNRMERNGQEERREKTDVKKVVQSKCLRRDSRALAAKKCGRWWIRWSVSWLANHARRVRAFGCVMISLSPTCGDDIAPWFPEEL
jgi:hypothetical protein